MPPRKQDETRIYAAPIIAWLLVQIAALALAAFKVPLAAQYPQPGEFQAVRLVLAAQFCALAILFPWLFRTGSSALAVLAAAWVMLWCAAALSAWSLVEILPAGAFLTAWVGVLAVFGRLKAAKWRLIVAALSAAYVIGGPLLWYLQAEFTSVPLHDPSAAFGPLLIVLTTPHHFPPFAWLEAAGAGAIALFAWKTDRKT
ncbi:MAG TPA: hypothetical protein VG273_25815 [Bryobacteraceae bacterium]|nr:hypothetical protein [Bryobacteraceae bacterium]